MWVILTKGPKTAYIVSTKPATAAIVAIIDSIPFAIVIALLGLLIAPSPREPAVTAYTRHKIEKNLKLSLVRNPKKKKKKL